jgi:hypothetical protein
MSTWQKGGVSMAKIEITARHNPLAWLLYFTRLRVVVDGQSRISKWGVHEYEVFPGEHRVEISFRYMGTQRGHAAANVTVTDTSPTRISYSMPSWMFAPGKITLT